MNPGDTVILYTDGVVDARRGKEFFGETRLRRLVSRATPDAEGVVTLLTSALAAFAGSAYRDDVAILAVSVDDSSERAHS